jgi:hypothetical protein
MAQIIKLKRSLVQGSKPTTSDLSAGELAINVYDGKVFLRKSGSADTVQEVLTNDYSGAVNLTGRITATEFVGDGSGLTNISVAQSATVRQYFEGSTWTVAHNLDTPNPLVQVYDGQDYQIIPQSVRITDDNTITITFPNIVSGSAVVGKGGHIVSGSVAADNISGFDTRVVESLPSGSISSSAQVQLFGDVTGTAISSSIQQIDGGDI